MSDSEAGALGGYIADRLVSLRKARNLQQSELARILGVATQTISQYECAKAIPSLPNLIKICDWAGSSLTSWLPPGEEESGGPDLSSHIGRQIRSVRAARNVTQAALAAHLGIATQSLSNYETGSSVPNLATLLKLTTWADKSLEFWLQPGEDAGVLQSPSRVSGPVPFGVDPEMESAHLSFPWGYLFRTSFLLFWVDELARRDGLRVSRVPEDPVFLVHMDREAADAEAGRLSSDSSLKMDFCMPTESFKLCPRTAYLLTSPYKCPSLKTMLDRHLLSERLRTNFRVSEYMDYFFSYPTRTVTITYSDPGTGESEYVPVFRSQGSGKAEFIDYCAVIDIAIAPDQPFRGGVDGEPSPEVDRLVICAGAHRLATGVALLVALNRGCLQSVLSMETSDGGAPEVAANDDFEMILRVVGRTGRLPSLDDVSVMQRRRV